MLDKISIGDPIEYAIMDRDDGQRWVPATVCHVDHYQICVADAAGNKRAISRNQPIRWRKVFQEVRV